MRKKRPEQVGKREATITCWRAKLRGDYEGRCFNHWNGDFTIIVHDDDIPLKMFMRFLHEILHVGLWMFLPDLAKDEKKEHQFIERVERGILKLLKEIY